MQKVDYNDIINFMGQYQDNQTLVNPTQPRIAFSVNADERVAFGDNAARFAEGLVTKVPMIYSSVANEGGSLQPYTPGYPYNGTNQTAANAITEGVLCGAYNSTLLRHAAGVSTPLSPSLPPSLPLSYLSRCDADTRPANHLPLPIRRQLEQPGPAALARRLPLL